jgi:hypothetical protein
MEGGPSIKIDNISPKKLIRSSSTHTQIPTQQKTLEKNPLLGFSVSDFDNNISKLIEQNEIKQARALCQKMIDLANATKQKRYKEKAEKVLNIIGYNGGAKKRKYR